MKNNVKEQYIPSPIWFIKLTSDKKSPLYLTPFQQLLYSLIKGLSSKKSCYAKDEYFEKIFKKSKKHVNDSIHVLEGLRLLKITNENNKRLISCTNGIQKDSKYYLYDKDQGIHIIATPENVYEFSRSEWNQLNNEKSEKYNGNLFLDLK